MNTSLQKSPELGRFGALDEKYLSEICANIGAVSKPMSHPRHCPKPA